MKKNICVFQATFNSRPSSAVPKASKKTNGNSNSAPRKRPNSASQNPANKIVLSPTRKVIRNIDIVIPKPEPLDTNGNESESEIGGDPPKLRPRSGTFSLSQEESSLQTLVQDVTEKAHAEDDDSNASADQDFVVLSAEANNMVEILENAQPEESNSCYSTPRLDIPEPRLITPLETSQELSESPDKDDSEAVKEISGSSSSSSKFAPSESDQDKDTPDPPDMTKDSLSRAGMSSCTLSVANSITPDSLVGDAEKDIKGYGDILEVLEKFELGQTHEKSDAKQVKIGDDSGRTSLKSTDKIRYGHSVIGLYIENTVNLCYCTLSVISSTTWNRLKMRKLNMFQRLFQNPMERGQETALKAIGN